MTLTEITTGLRDAIAADLADLHPKMRVYPRLPGVLGVKPPAQVIHVVGIEPGGEIVPDELGAKGHLLTFPVSGVFDAGDAVKAQAAGEEWVTETIPALINSTRIGLLAEDEPTVLAADAELAEGGPKGLFFYTIELQVPILTAY